jgi:hypothetical protein
MGLALTLGNHMQCSTSKKNIKKTRSTTLLNCGCHYVYAFALAFVLLLYAWHSCVSAQYHVQAAVAVQNSTSIAVQVDWAYPTGPSGERTAAVYTPYPLTFGGGERYLLYTVAVLQQLGYTTDVIVSPGNTCNTTTHLLTIARGLRVPLKNDTNLVVVPKDFYKLRTQKHYVRVGCE